MTIVSTCERVVNEIAAYKELEQAHNDAEKFRTRKDALAPLRETMGADLARLKILRGRGIAFRPPKLSSTLVASVEELQSNLDDADAARPNSYAKAKTAISKASEVVGSSVQAAVAAIETPLGAVEEPLLKQMESIPALKQRASEARTKREELQKAHAKRLNSPDDLSAFLSKRAELLLIADQLKNEDLPKEVLAFFKAVRGGHATLDLFTDVVREWLAEHHQLQDVRITMITK